MSCTQVVGTGLLPLLLVVAAGCTTSPSASPPAPIRTFDVAAEYGAEVAAIDRRVTASYERWAGSLASRQAEMMMLAWDLNGAFSECMEEAGFDYQWENWAQLAEPEDPLTASVWLRKPGAELQSEGLLARAWGRDQDSGHPEPTSAAQDAAIDVCRELGPAGGDRETWGLRKDALMNRWEESLQPVQDRFGTGSQFLACVREKLAADQPSVDRPLHDLASRLEEEAPDPDVVPLPGEPADDEWLAYLELERPLREADWA